MSTLTNHLFRTAARFAFRARRFQYRQLRRFASGVHGKVVLEIGSGRQVRGRYPYSAQHLFDQSNEFIRSDVVASWGHRLIDISQYEASNQFDVILCLNVLEHIYDYRQAFDNLHRAAKPGGTVIVGVPGYYPLHDEPFDYWRFTEHALRRLMAPYSSLELFNSGLRRYPFAYFVKAVK